MSWSDGTTTLHPLHPAPQSPKDDAKLIEALTWALAEIRCATRYDNEQQFWNSYDLARCALNEATNEPFDQSPNVEGGVVTISRDDAILFDNIVNCLRIKGNYKVSDLCVS